jgi:hypothetical protein
MGPLVIGLSGLALWAIFGHKKTPTASPAGTPIPAAQASPSSLAASAQMLFRDYQWTVLVPSLTDVSNFLSPPPGATIGSGKWWKYPGGIARGPWGPLRGGYPAGAGPQTALPPPSAAGVPTAGPPVGASPSTVGAVLSRASVSPPAGGAPVSPPAGGVRKTVQVAAWGGVAPTACVYAWRPNSGTSQALNGYLLYGTDAWYVNLASATPGHGTFSGFNLYIAHHDLPPPPAAGTAAATIAGNAGKGASWQLKHPGLLVWIGASNANEADLQALSAPVTMTGAPALAGTPS